MQGVKEMIVTCFNHVLSIKLSEFGEKKWSVLAISDEVIPPGRSRKRRNKIYVAEIRLLHRWEKRIKFFGKQIYHVKVFPNLTNDDFNDI